MEIKYQKSHKHYDYEDKSLDFDAFSTNECGKHITNYFVAQFYTPLGLAYRLNLDGREIGKKCYTIEEAKEQVSHLIQTTDKICMTPVKEIVSCVIEIW